MANVAQLKALIQSHFSDDRERFTTVALQVAAHEAKLGRQVVAEQIRALIDKSKLAKQARVIKFKPDLAGLIEESDKTRRIQELVVSNDILKRLTWVLKEYSRRDKLANYGLSFRRKLLLAGPPGTGKTLTASVLAHETELPFYIIQVDRMVTKYMGETSAKLRLIFDAIADTPGVYLFDEFDTIGAERGRDNEVGEMRRVLNSFLQFIERDDSESFIITATNNAHILDSALHRRFDDIIEYSNPDKNQILNLISNRLGNFKSKAKFDFVANKAVGLSHADITSACYNALKMAIMHDDTIVTPDLLQEMIIEKMAGYSPRK